MDEYICLTIQSRPGESQQAFSARLSRFWTHLLRTQPEDFERVYAETTVFEECSTGWSLQYLIEESVSAVLEGELRSAGLEHEPIDREEVYSRYEAVPPEWRQIEH